LTDVARVPDLARGVRVTSLLRFWPHLLVVLFLNVGYHRAQFSDADRAALYQRFLRDPMGATLADPVAALRVHHVRDGDEILYLNWANYMLGRPADVAFMRELSDEKIDLLPLRPDRSPLLPYRDFVFQYPPLSAAPMVAAAAITSDPLLYPYAFAALAAVAALVIAVAGAALHARLGPPEELRPHLWLSALALFLVGVTLETRLDVFAAAAVALALWAMAADRPALAGALLGAGAALKIYPGLLVPAFLAPLVVDGRRREAATCLGAFAGTLVLACLPAALVSWPGFVHALGIHSIRGVQIESLSATVIAWVRTMRGEPLDVVRAFGARDLSGGAAPAVAAAGRVLVPLLALAGGILAALDRSVPRLQRVVDGVTLAIAGIWVASPVLSAQYLVWGLPAFLLARSRVSCALFLAALAVTRVEYPACYLWVGQLSPAGLVLLTVRNALLVAVFAALWRWPRPKFA
jgi:Glycosyltransferase family 87